jgi:hypothetical protein
MRGSNLGRFSFPIHVNSSFCFLSVISYMPSHQFAIVLIEMWIIAGSNSQSKALKCSCENNLSASIATLYPVKAVIEDQVWALSDLLNAPKIKLIFHGLPAVEYKHEITI